MRKILALALATLMVLSGTSVLAESAFTPAASYTPDARVFNGGVILLDKIEAGEEGTVTTTAFAGVPGKDYTDEKVYTYNDFMTAMGSGLDWNPHTWETNDDSYIMNYNTIGFYDFVVNETGDGYSVYPEMAAELPVDVTNEYVGKFGVAEGESAKAWRIALNPEACWDDGTPINADSYVYALKEQLNPLMLNRRADSWYSGTFIIVNAKNYLYAGQTTYNALSDGVYASAPAALEAGADLYVDMWGFWGMQGMLDADGNECPQYVSINDEVLYRDLAVEADDGEEAWVSAKYFYDNYLAVGMQYESYAPTYLAYASQAAVVGWDDVGLVKVDDYTIDLITEKPIADPAFYVPYNLSGTWLVKEDLYEACKKYFDAAGTEIDKDGDVASITTNYCTSLETTANYGPYKLTYYELDKQITLERNENWYGWKDGRHIGQFQMDRLSCQIIPDHATQLMAFEAGEIDGVSLQSADMEKYGASDYIKYTPESYTTKISFNQNYEKLLEHGTNSQVLVIDEFRKAFSLCYDREEFATSFTAAGSPGYGMLNYMYVYDPFTGALYRDSDYAKDGLVTLFGLTYGEGGEYATLDEAYDAMTGYDMPAAQAAMAIAYDKAVAAGIYDGVSPIEIEFEVYQNDTIYVQMFTYLDEHIQEACKGSGFEGKLKLKMTPDPDYYETMYSGGTDVIFTTWGGAAFDPFGVFSRVYCDAADGSGNQMEIGYDTSLIQMTLTADGVDHTYSLQQWANWAGNEDVPGLTETLGNFGEYSYETRCAVVSRIELCYMSYYPTSSVYYRNVASLNSQKVNDAVDTYLQLVGFGGLRFMTFNYDDTEWAAHVASGTLQY